MSQFKEELVHTYQTIIDIIRFNGGSDIVTNRRIASYKKAIIEVRENESKSKKEAYDVLLTVLTFKPIKVMESIYKKGEVTLDKKSPYYGVTIRDGKVTGEHDFAKKYNEELHSFENLSQLTGIGVGIGDSSIAELVKMGYTRIDQLREKYKKDQFEDFRKGLQGPLRKYFEGVVRDSKISREEAKKWKKIIDQEFKELKKDYPNLLFKIAGSYGRNEQMIGDIDYVVTYNDNQKLFDILIHFLGKMNTMDNCIIEETPKYNKKKRYSTNVKLWIGKLKIEIYGYSQPREDWCFPYFARTAQVELQRKMKICASKKGYKLGPWSIDKKGTDTPIWEFPDGKELVKKRLGKEKITKVIEIYKFLEYEKEG